MDLRNLAAKLSKIDALEQRVAELELMVLELAAGVSEPSDSVREPEVLTLADPKVELAQQVEQYISTRISSWKYAVEGEDGSWRAPLTASRIAEGLGLATADWRKIKRLMSSDGVWENVSWYMAPPPSDWRSGASNAKWIQWVVLRKGA